MNLLDFDQRYIWHPYAAAGDKSAACVTAAHGCLLELDNGQNIIDGMSSWWAAIHGYNHPFINQAAIEQIQRMSHVMFGGLTHPEAIKLGRKLANLLPKSLNQIFYCDSGSVAVEVACKMVWQYWQIMERSSPIKHKKFVCLKHAYHGDTCMAMSLCDPKNSMHSIFKGLINEQIFVPPPRYSDEPDAHAEDALVSVFDKNIDSIAAMIVEPLVQGAGGMRFYSSTYLERARELCSQTGTLLIFDEIATGFGRLGSMFAMEEAQVTPDIVCLGKALGGGYLSFAATVTNPCVAEVISRGQPGILMHGPTYMGNPLACAIANANLDLLETGVWKQQVSAIETYLKDALVAICCGKKSVKEVRVKGAIGVVEMHKPVHVERLTEIFLHHGVWLRPFRNLIYTTPPYTIEPSQLTKIVEAIEAAIIASD